MSGFCQESINQFISGIPDKASEIAMTTVNHLIEDQVGDPNKLELNINRVKSVFSLIRNAGGDFGGGDCKVHEKKMLLTIPRKVRQHIWKYLDDDTVKTLRLVCQQLKHEMDFDVGLSVIITPEAFNSFWMRSISIRSCIVKKMTTVFVLNLFAKPEKLERIYFDSEVLIDADMAELIIRKFRNVRQIVLYTEDFVELRNMQEEATSNGLSSKLITRLEDQFLLTAIDVKFDTSKWKLKWNIKLKPQVCDRLWEVQDVMGPFGVSGITRVLPPARDLSKRSLQTVTLSIPFVQERDRFIWLKMLHTQNRLVSLTCDLNATHWRDYERIVKKNSETLQKLFLLNFTNGTNSFVGGAAEGNTPFDWTMFEECNELQEMTLIAESFMRSSFTNFNLGKSRSYMESVNLSTLKCKHLRAVWLENFSFSEDEVEFLKWKDQGTKEHARFELCTLKNCKLGREEVEEAHVGSKKGRNRCLECLCFGTMSYDDDNLDSFEKFTAAKLATMNKKGKGKQSVFCEDMDMIECFQYASEDPIQNGKRSMIGDFLVENVNLLGGIAFTAWLVWTK